VSGALAGALLERALLARSPLSQPEVTGQPQMPKRRSTGGGGGMKENNLQKNMPCFAFFFFFIEGKGTGLVRTSNEPSSGKALLLH